MMAPTMMAMATAMKGMADDLDDMDATPNVRQARQHLATATAHMRDGDPKAAATEMRAAHQAMTTEADAGGDNADDADTMATRMQQMMQHMASMTTGAAMDHALRTMAGKTKA